MKIQYAVLSVVVALGLGVYGGMQYEKTVATKSAPERVRDFAGGNRQAGGQQAGQNGGAMRRGGPNGGGFVTGEILSKDEKSLTIKTQDGGSTIVYFTEALGVRKAEAGSVTRSCHRTTGRGEWEEQFGWQYRSRRYRFDYATNGQVSFSI